MVKKKRTGKQPGDVIDTVRDLEAKIERGVLELARAAWRESMDSGDLLAGFSEVEAQAVNRIYELRMKENEPAAVSVSWRTAPAGETEVMLSVKRGNGHLEAVGEVR